MLGIGGPRMQVLHCTWWGWMQIHLTIKEKGGSINLDDLAYIWHVSYIQNWSKCTYLYTSLQKEVGRLLQKLYKSSLLAFIWLVKCFMYAVCLILRMAPWNISQVILSHLLYKGVRLRDKTSHLGSHKW